MFEETQYSKAVEFQNWLSNVGGFVGIFLGYSLMQLPELFIFILELNVLRKYRFLKGKIVLIRFEPTIKGLINIDERNTMYSITYSVLLEKVIKFLTGVRNITKEGKAVLEMSKMSDKVSYSIIFIHYAILILKLFEQKYCYHNTKLCVLIECYLARASYTK